MNYGRAPWSHVILKSKACTKINLSGHPGVYALITVSYLFFRERWTVLARMGICKNAKWQFSLLHLCKE